MTESKSLAVPPAAASHFTKNFIRQAVCELRFPTLYEFDQLRPPVKFALALRKEYPSYNAVKDVDLIGGSPQVHGHQFKSKKGRWTVTFRASAVSIETSNYDSFTELRERLAFIIKTAELVIDSDFFTRVGLRYINSVPYNEDDICDWINPQLVGVLGSGLYGDTKDHSARVSGSTVAGSYLFQHGLAINQDSRKREYFLDFDFSQEDVAISDTLEVVDVLHENEFSMFTWALGSTAKEYLGPSALKK